MVWRSWLALVGHRAFRYGTVWLGGLGRSVTARLCEFRYGLAGCGGRGSAAYVKVGQGAASSGGQVAVRLGRARSVAVGRGGQLTAMRGDKNGWFSKKRTSKNY